MLEHSVIKLISVFSFFFFFTLCVANRESRAELKGREKTTSKKETINSIYDHLIVVL